VLPLPMGDPLAGRCFSLSPHRRTPARMTESESAIAWAALLAPEELPGVVYALGIVERAGQVTPDEVRAWRWAILDRHGLPVRLARA